MVRKIIQIGDKILLQKSEEVTKEDLLSRETQELIDDMLDTCNKEEESTAGLSAVQIGVLKRIYIARLMEEEEETNEPNWIVMVNPEIKVIDKAPSRMWEGCLSIGEAEERLFAPVSRPRKIEVTYLNREGKKESRVVEDYSAHVVLHEQDHLDGILFLSHVKNPSLIWKSADLDDYIEEYDQYPPSS